MLDRIVFSEEIGKRKIFGGRRKTLKNFLRNHPGAPIVILFVLALCVGMIVK